MKLLLVVSSLNNIKKFSEHFAISLIQNQSLPFLHSTKILYHEVDVLESGVGVHQTAYKITKVLSQQKYHLALKIAFGNAYKEETQVGAVLNIINEKPGDFGTMAGSEWKDFYDLGLTKPEDLPYVRGGLVNMNNAYMNVFMPFKKVVGVTVNHYADTATYKIRKEKYKADCETGDGAGFVYTCLFEKQSFYQLCVIEKNLATGVQNFELAGEVMNNTLTELIQKL